jgi:hypothetical protein
MISAYLTLLAFMMFILLPLFIRVAVTLAPLAMAGIRRTRRGIANGRQVLGTLISQRRMEFRPAV